MDEQLEKRNKLALDVLRLSRNTLLVNLRFLDAALNQLEPLAVEGLTLATDGEALAYDPAHVLRLYRDEREAVTRAYLHMVLHGVFRHMFVHTLVDHHVWDLACDIAAEYVIAPEGDQAAHRREDLPLLPGQAAAAGEDCRAARRVLQRRSPPLVHVGGGAGAGAGSAGFRQRQC